MTNLPDILFKTSSSHASCEASCRLTVKCVGFVTNSSICTTFTGYNFDSDVNSENPDLKIFVKYKASFQPLIDRIDFTCLNWISNNKYLSYKVNSWMNDWRAKGYPRSISRTSRNSNFTGLPIPITYEPIVKIRYKICDIYDACVYRYDFFEIYTNSSHVCLQGDLKSL